MWALLATAVPLGADAQTWAQFGVMGLLVGWSQYKDYRREDATRTAREADRQFEREQMLPAIKHCSHVIEQCTRQLERCGRPA